MSELTIIEVRPQPSPGELSAIELALASVASPPTQAVRHPSAWFRAAIGEACAARERP